MTNKRNPGVARVAQEMKARGLTHEAAAKLLGVSRSYLTRVLAYDRAPSLTLAIGARNAFGIDPALFDGEHVSSLATTSAPAKRCARVGSNKPSRRARAGGRPSQASEAGR